MLGINKTMAMWGIALGILLTQGAAEAAQTPMDKLEINGDLRFAYGSFKSKSDYGVKKHHYKEVNTKVGAFYSFDKSNCIDVGVCDIRVPNAHENDRGAYINRAFFKHDKEKYGVTVGRIPHCELDNNVIYAYENYLDGVKVRLGTEDAQVEIFGGALGKKQDRQRGYYLKGIKAWKRWSAKSVFFAFDKAENITSWNHQKIWSNSVVYKFDDRTSVSYERLNFAGQNWGEKANSQSGYVAGFNWSNFDVAKPHTFDLSLNYYHQPQGTFFKYHHSAIALVDEFDRSGPGHEGGAMGFKGPGVYFGYVLAKGIILNLEAYKLKNIYEKSSTFKHEVVGAYIDVMF